MENTFVLICQILVSSIFILAGIFKLINSKKDLSKIVSWSEDYNRATLLFIGALELIGGLGVLLPLIFNIYLWLVPMACMGLAMVMSGAIVVHIRREEFGFILLNLFILFMSAGVSFYRLLELNLDWIY